MERIREVPEEVWALILGYVDPRDLAAARRACRALDAACRGPLVWRLLYERAVLPRLDPLEAVAARALRAIAFADDAQFWRWMLVSERVHRAGEDDAPSTLYRELHTELPEAHFTDRVRSAFCGRRAVGRRLCVCPTAGVAVVAPPACPGPRRPRTRRCCGRTRRPRTCALSRPPSGPPWGWTMGRRRAPLPHRSGRARRRRRGRAARASAAVSRTGPVGRRGCGSARRLFGRANGAGGGDAGVGRRGPCRLGFRRFPLVRGDGRPWMLPCDPCERAWYEAFGPIKSALYRALGTIRTFE